MPVPALNDDGFLPPGIWDCKLAELRERFGIFSGSDQRPRLFARLDDLFQTLQRSGLFETLLVDGSFVTAKPAPNDIDLVAVLLPGHDFERDLPMSEYALVSRAMLRRRYGFDVVIAEKDSPLCKTYVEFFSRVRDNPGASKGLLRLSL
ncbi:MAG: hypothetical protein HZA89_11965 [Verrucomicrobia bacterium]|nr:hypothetical protein [Verrucomicrobiota bacterium]